MACSLTNTKKLFRKNNILNRFDQLTQDTGANVTKFNQLAYQVKQLAIAKYGALPEGALKPIKLDGRKAVFNPIFFEWVDRKNDQLSKTNLPIKPGVEELFESNPELANAVYEALGFKSFDTKGVSLDTKERDGWKWIKLNGKNIGEVKLVKNDRRSKEVGLSIKLNEEYQNKGYGQIVHTLVADWAKNEFGDTLYSDFDNSQAEINTLLALTKKGYAEQIGDYGIQQDGRYSTDVRAFRIKTSNEIGTITPQQKQQAQQLYSQYLDTKQSDVIGFTQTITQDDKSYYRGQIEKPTIDKDGNLVLYAREDELYKRAGLPSKGVSMTDDLQSAIEYGNGQLEVAQNLASESYDAEQELERLSNNGYYLIQIPKNISNEIVKEAGEVKIIGDKIIIPKGQYRIEQIIEGEEAEITPQPDVIGFKKFVKSSTVSSDFSSLFYQLTDSAKLEKNDLELDTFLLDFLEPFGVKTEELQDYKERFRADSLGVTDVLNKLIYYSGNRNIETIPEEFGHMLSFLMGPKHPIMAELFKEISNWEEYAQIYKDYYAEYDYNANKVRLEAIGKLIAKRLVAKYKESKTPKSKLEQLIDKLIDMVMKTLSRFYKSGYYSKYLADKIAVQVLMGNRDFVYEGYKEKIAQVANFVPVSFEKALNENKLAASIVENYGYKFGNPLVGSIAIAGQGERILRSPDEPIHDLDFIVGSEDKYLAMMPKLIKDGAQPVHYGWSNNNKSYTTYAYLIPLEGHTIEVVKREQSGWIAKYGEGKLDIIVRNSEGKVVEATPQNVISVDFFVYPNNAPFNENVIDDKFSSWQDIFRGKLGLSALGDNEVMFQRDKDQVDYIMNNPVSRALKPNPIFMFYQLDSNKNTVDPTATPKSKLEEQYLKQIKSLKNRLAELQSITGRESRLEISSRIRVIKNSIEELEGNASVAKLFNIAFYDIAAAKSILKKSADQTTAFDMNEMVRILSVLEGFDVAMADIITDPEEKKYVIAIRNAVAEMTPEFHKKLATVIERISKGEGYDYTYAQITKAVKDLGDFTSQIYSPEESNIPILRIAASVLNQFEADVRDEKIEHSRKYKELVDKYKNFDYSTLIENGHLILPYREEYYEQEAKLQLELKEIRAQIREMYTKAEEAGKEPNKIKLQGLYQKRNLFEARLFSWYRTNNTYYLTPEMEEEFKNDLKVKRESLTDPLTGEVDEKAYEDFVREHSPYENAAGKLINEVVDVDGRKMKVFNIITDNIPKGRWYRYLTSVPKTEGKVDWTNPKYEQVKDNEVYKFIIETITEAHAKVPHDLYSETAGPHKILRKVMYDATNNSFAFRTWGKDALDTVKNWYSLELTASEIEDRYKGITDYAGREKTTIKAPDLRKMKGAANPLELANNFFELATEYDNATKVVPVTDLLQYVLSQMDALRTNSITGEMYKIIIDGSRTEPEIVKQGLINAQKSLRYKTDSVLSKKTRLDEDNIKVTPEERADLVEREKKWVEGGMVGPRPTIRKTSHVVIFDAVTDFTRLNLIGLKPFTAAANVIMGMSSNFMYAARNKEFGDKHLWKATNVILQSLFKASYKSKIATKDAIKLTLLAEKFGVVTNLFEGQDRGATSISKAVNKLMYLMQERGEYSIHTQLMLAMMYAQNVTDTTGKEGNLWDAYSVETDAAGNNYLAWNEKKFGAQEAWQNRQVLDASGLNISKLKKFEANLRRIRIATQGDYQNALLGKSKWFKRTAFLFRTWLPSAIRQRFGEEIEGEFKGRYRSWSQYAKSSYKKAGLVGVLGQTLKTSALVGLKTFLIGPLSFLGMKELSKITNQNYEESLKGLGLSDLDIENMRVNIRELQMILFLAILAGAFKQLADDDDDPELTFAINLAQRTNQDLTFFISPDSAMAVIKDPIPIFKTFQDATDVIVAIRNRIEDPQKDIYQRGRYKGQSKVSKEFIDLFPGWSGIRSTIGVTQQQFSSQSYKHR